MCYNIVASTLIYISIILSKPYISKLFEEFINKLFYIFLPSYTLSEGIFSVALVCTTLEEYLIFEMFLSNIIYYMFISGLTFWFILFFLESKTILINLHRLLFFLRKSIYQAVGFFFQY